MNSTAPDARLRLEELLEELRIGHVRNTRGLSLSGR